MLKLMQFAIAAGSSRLDARIDHHRIGLELPLAGLSESYLQEVYEAFSTAGVTETTLRPSATFCIR